MEQNALEEWRDFLRANGFAAKKIQYVEKETDSTPDWQLPHFHPYAKINNTHDVYRSLQCATKEGGGDKIPYFAYRKTNHPWVVTMLATDWLTLVKDTRFVMQAFCPRCHTDNVQSNGRGGNVKHGKQQKKQYICRNPECDKRYFTFPFK